MRGTRRRGHGVLEFGGSGEDSFVAVVVTKLTGALLFILLLTMVIMALTPRAVEMANPATSPSPTLPLAVTTPRELPEAIAGRPYALALAASGGSGKLSWKLEGEIPKGLEFDPSTATIRGTPLSSSATAVALTAKVSDGSTSVSQPLWLVVYRPDTVLSLPSKWAPSILPVSWRLWLEHGVGFVLLILVHLVAMGILSTLQIRAEQNSLSLATVDGRELSTLSDVVWVRFTVYRWLVRLATISAIIGLATWLAGLWAM